MDVTHPGSKPLDADQLSLLETFRGKVDSRITNHGLTAADVQMFADEIKKHPTSALRSWMPFSERWPP